MKILLTASSRHGATDEVAAVIAEQLRAAGLEVDHARPEDVADVEGYDAFVLGSAVYMTRWTEEAVDFTRRFSSALRDRPVWAFSVGLSGLPKGKIADPYRIGPVLLSIDPEDHITFPGRFDPGVLNVRERTIARMGGHPVQWFVRREWRCRDSVSIGLSAYRPIGLSVCRRDRCPGSAPGSSSGSAGTYSIGLPSAAGSLCEASSASPTACE